MQFNQAINTMQNIAKSPVHLKGLRRVSNDSQQKKILVTCAASRVLTRSKGYVAEAAVIPDKPPPTKCTRGFALEFPLTFFPVIECNSYNTIERR